MFLLLHYHSDSAEYIMPYRSDEKSLKHVATKISLQQDVIVAWKFVPTLIKTKGICFALDFPIFPMSAGLILKKTTEQQDKRFHVVLKCPLDNLLSTLVDLLNRRTKKSIAALINLSLNTYSVFTPDSHRYRTRPWNVSISSLLNCINCLSVKGTVQVLPHRAEALISW